MLSPDQGRKPAGTMCQTSCRIGKTEVYVFKYPEHKYAALRIHNLLVHFSVQYKRIDVYSVMERGENKSS